MNRHPEHLLLARHGRAEHNEIKKFMNDENIGQLPPEVLAREVEYHPLTAEGVEQARALGRWLSQVLVTQEGLRPNRYYVSPTARTLQTAGYASQILEADHPDLSIGWIQDRRLRETHKGNIEQLRKLPGYDISQEPQIILPTSELYRRTDGGESIYETMERWSGFRNARRHELSGAIGLVVTHGYFMGAVELAMEADGMADHEALELFHSRSPANCNIVHYSNVEPETGEVADSLRWVRAVLPYESPKGFEFNWREIGSPAVFSSAELLEAGNRYERLIDPVVSAELASA